MKRYLWKQQLQGLRHLDGAGMLVAAALLAVTFLFVGCSSLPVNTPTPVQTSYVSQVKNQVTTLYLEDLRSSLQSCVNKANEFEQSHAQLEQLCENSRDSSFAASLAQHRTAYAEKIVGGLEQVRKSRDAVAKGQEWISHQKPNSEEEAQSIAGIVDHLEQASNGLAAMEELLTYEKSTFDALNALGQRPENPSVDNTGEYYSATWEAYGSFSAISPAACMNDLHERYTSLWETAGTFYFDASTTNSYSELDRRSLFEVMDWTAAREAMLAKLQSWVSARQYNYIATLLMGKAESQAAPEVDFRCVSRVAPNLYGSLDSALDVIISSPTEESVIVEVEIAGFSLAHTTKVALRPGVNYFRVKPEILPSLTAADLERASTTQINFKMTTTTGEIIEQQSQSVEVLSVYDYIWENDDFGFAAQFELFAWLRPGHSEIDQLVRRAADYMSDWTDGFSYEINGYQYGEDWYATLLQVAAIQKAFSDSDIAYIIDTYTPTADQRVLTTPAVFEKRQALCIESSLVMASAILSAGMHPMVIITPGHAQVAVETWADSGQYFLIETSQLPYSGLDRGIDANSAWAYSGLVPVYDDGAGSFSWVESQGASYTWERYFNWVEDYDSDNYGGIFVLDCYLQRIMDIRGLEAM